jgi:C4-dicarboxylate transporter DctM subunit
MTWRAEAARRAAPDAGGVADHAGHRQPSTAAWPRPPNPRRWAWPARWCSAALEGSLTWVAFKEGIFAACRVYCMIGLILAGAAFPHAGHGLHRPAARSGRLHRRSAPVARSALLMLLMVFFIVLSCFLDGISMVVLTMAVLLPTVQAAGIDLIWFGVFVVLVVEMAQITPPVGFNLFVLQGLTQRELPYLARTAHCPSSAC